VPADELDAALRVLERVAQSLAAMESP